MRLLLALLGVALVAAGPSSSHYPTVVTRPGCPPDDTYTAISAHYRLDNFPSGGKYAICRTSDDATTGVEFTVDHGVFKLRDSVLLIDSGVSIKFAYPARPDWSNVVVDSVEGAHEGISIRGAPTDAELAAYHRPWPVPFGNCGDLVKVNLAGAGDNFDSLTFDHCSSATTIKNPVVFDGQSGLSFVDSKEVIVYEPRIASSVSGGVGVTLVRSQVGLIQPSIYVVGSSLVVEDGSALTACKPFLETAVGAEIHIADQADEHPSTVAIAGVTNLVFPGDLSFDNNGIVYTLKHCPSVFKSSYNMGEWNGWYTTGI